MLCSLDAPLSESDIRLRGIRIDTTAPAMPDQAFFISKLSMGHAGCTSVRRARVTGFRQFVRRIFLGKPGNAPPQFANLAPGRLEPGASTRRSHVVHFGRRKGSRVLSR